MTSQTPRMSLLQPGTKLGPYQIVSQLGSGGMGVVYTATDPRLKRTVAIKLLPPDLTRDDTAKRRFLQEAQAASALDHPNICNIHEINETADGQLYLVMAHYEGQTLKERIARGPLVLNDAIDIATQVGKGLAKAHAAGGRRSRRGLRPRPAVCERRAPSPALESARGPLRRHDRHHGAPAEPTTGGRKGRHLLSGGGAALCAAPAPGERPPDCLHNVRKRGLSDRGRVCC